MYSINIAALYLVIASLITLVISLEFAMAQEPHANVVCDTLNITSISIASRPSGSINVLGIVANSNSTLTYEGVGVVGEFYDSNNKLIGVESGNAEFSTLGPDDRSPFKIKTDVSNQTLDHYTVICRSSEGRFSSQMP